MSNWDDRLSDVLTKQKEKTLKNVENFDIFCEAAHNLLANDIRDAFIEFKEHLDSNTNYTTDVINENLKETIIVESMTGFNFKYSIFPYFREDGFIFTTLQVLRNGNAKFEKFLEKKENGTGYSLKKEALLSDVVLEFSAALAKFNGAFWENSNAHI